jgi:hypothetical protein
MNVENGTTNMPADGLEPNLAWLADAPAFIDSPQVSAFYEAVVGPAFRAVELQVSTSRSEQHEKSASGHLNASLSALFPWWKFDAGGEIRRAGIISKQDEQSVTLEPIQTAARQLVQLAVHYLVNQPHRICLVDQNAPLPDKETIAESPRMIAFVDVQPGTKFLPQAAELNDGQVVTFFDPLIEALNRDRTGVPTYPDNPATEAGKRQKEAYWRWFIDHWNMDRAVEVVEEGIGSRGRPRWIAYRMVFDSGEALHLDVTPRGDYDTGVFAYNFIRRGERHGLRMVGSLKSQPAMNVLAIYEK